MLLAFDFKCQNFEPTRVTATSSTCLDHVITSYQLKTETIQTTMSDHFTVLETIPGVFFNEPVISEEKIYRRDLRSIKGDKALNFLFLLDQKLKKLDQLDKLDIQKITETIMFCVDKFALEKETTKTEKCNEWITNKIKNEIIKRNELFREWTVSSKNQRNKVTAMIEKAKRECNLQKLGNNPNAKTLYRNLKSHKRKDQNAELTPDLKTLNEFFTTIGSKLADAVPPSNKEYFVPKFEKTMVPNYTNQHETSKFLAKMKNKKNSGHDGISNEILKCCSPVIEIYLTNCFNNCIEKQFFPNSLKIAKVIPLYKKGNANDPGNYRPICLLSSLSKVFEKLLYNRMVSFFNKKGLFTAKQYGFRSRKSCA